MRDTPEEKNSLQQENVKFLSFTHQEPLCADVDEAGDVKEKQILKNIVLISVTFLLMFTCYIGLVNLQSSLHIQEGMGVITQSIVYGVMATACLILPKPVIHILGHKWAIIFSMTGYILWMAANGYAVWGTMIGASIYLGLCASVLWTAKCAYFATAARKYAKVRGEGVDVANSRFFGIFFSIHRLNGVISATIQTTVLHQGNSDNSSGPSDDNIAKCGLNDCPWNNATNENFQKPPTKVIWTLVGIYIGISLLALLMASVFVDNLPKTWLPKDDQSGANIKKVIKSTGATVRCLRHINLLLLIPLTMYIGMEQTFYTVEFYKSYTTCSLGMWLIALLALPGCLMNAITSIASGHVVKCIGSLPVFITAMAVSIGAQITLLFWTPHPSQLYMFILVPLLHGFVDGIWRTQLNALYGTLFPLDSEAAYSNYRLWESIGFICAFAWSSHLCTSFKLHITMCFFYTGSVLLLALYARQAILRKKKYEI